MRSWCGYTIGDVLCCILLPNYWSCEVLSSEEDAKNILNMCLQWLQITIATTKILKVFLSKTKNHKKLHIGIIKLLVTEIVNNSDLLYTIFCCEVRVMSSSIQIRSPTHLPKYTRLNAVGLPHCVISKPLKLYAWYRLKRSNRNSYTNRDLVAHITTLTIWMKY